jgi:drug/metabolite transporter (DMT)-like permease
VKWVLLGLVIFTAVFGDLLQSREMKIVGRGSDRLPGAWRVMRLIVERRYLLLAILCMAVSFFAFLALVQTEPISFAVPASAGSFVIETLLAKLWLKERLSARRSLGTLVVFGGILLVAR